MRLIDADALEYDTEWSEYHDGFTAYSQLAIDTAPSIDIVRCKECRKSHIDGKTTHYLWCVEWGRSTDTFGYCERGEREDEMGEDMRQFKVLIDGHEKRIEEYRDKKREERLVEREKHED